MMNQLQKQWRSLSLGLLLVTALAACAAPANQGATTDTQSDSGVTSQSDSGITAQETVTSTVTTGADQGTAGGATDNANAATAKVNLNTATEEELLAAVPNLGERMVDEFMEYRPYASIQQFRREIGKYVDEAQVSDYEQYVYVPVNVNEADADTLMQIPGVDATAAEALIAARPYNDDTAFLDQLTQVAPTVDRASAEGYLATQ